MTAVVVLIDVVSIVTAFTVDIVSVFDGDEGVHSDDDDDGVDCDNHDMMKTLLTQE